MTDSTPPPHPPAPPPAAVPPDADGASTSEPRAAALAAATTAASPDDATNAPLAPATPFAGAELAAMLRWPGRSFDAVLGEHRRLGASLAGPPAWRLAAVLTALIALTSLPFGVVLTGADCWKVAALFGGSVLLCWPSLQVFGAYLGCGLHPAQSLALALLTACVATMFTFGFAPILWFLQVTMQHGDRVDAADAASAMLTVALLAGLAHAARCCAARTAGHRDRAFVLLIVWQVLVLMLTIRMARALGLP
jgi:hypothetical protein